MIQMLNTYETIRESLHFNKFTVGELLFVEYKCPIEQDVAGVWAPMDYFIHVLSGKKTWRTRDGTWTAEKGQTLFFKKGAAIVYQDFRDDFCVMVFFVSDDFIRDVVRELAGQLRGRDGESRSKKRRGSLRAIWLWRLTSNPCWRTSPAEPSRLRLCSPSSSRN